jgi:hypothetical protein
MQKLLIAAVLFGLAGPASARVYKLTIDGTIVSGTDDTGIVVAPGGSLAGLSYSFVATFDDATPGSDLFAEDDFLRLERAGTGVLRIGRSYTFAFDGANVAELVVENEVDKVSTIIGGSCPDVFLCGFFGASLRSSVSNFLAGPGLGLPVNHVWMPGDNFNGQFRLGGFNDGFYALRADLGDEGTLVTLSATAVPEPAAWAMLIAGFGLVGAAARRRRPQVRASAR